ncbi:MAG: RNA polymerase sigma factor [Myxococcales bacterium]|nr:RNA polymerase sigma factor [Myxococcales bacterium]
MPSDLQASREARFEQLMQPHWTLLRGYVHRMVGVPVDAEDLVQDIALKALERLESLRDDAAFRGWLMRLATTTCIDHLRRKKRWHPHAQFHYEQRCAEDDELRQQVVDATRDPEFAYDVEEHLAFCFTCVGRSLAPEQAAALMLREVLGLSNREAAHALEVTESVLRHHLSAGRRSMEEAFEGLCSLVSKEGICRQCAGFRSVTREDRRGPQLPVLHDAQDPFQARLDRITAKDFHGGRARILHELMLTTLERLQSERAGS